MRRATLTERPESVRGALERVVRKHAGRGRSSLVAGVSIAGERSYFGFGPAGAVPDPRTLFEIGSITKAFTGTLLADMHLRGEVSLDDPLSRHLPGVALPRWRGPEPTLAQLATHHGGLPNAPGALAVRELAFSAGVLSRDPWADVTAREYEALVARIRPRPAGRRARYSSVGFGLLGDALARHAGRPYEQLVRERICLPLGMDDTRIDVATADLRLLPGLSRRGIPRPPIEDLMPAAGSIRSHAEDMLRFLDAAVQPSRDSPGPALRLAQTPYVRLRGPMSGGLGWMLLERRRQPRLVWHNGGTWGFRSFAALVPERRVAIVVLSNTTRSVDGLGFGLAKAASAGVRSIAR